MKLGKIDDKILDQQLKWDSRETHPAASSIIRPQHLTRHRDVSREGERFFLGNAMDHAFTQRLKDAS